MSNTSSSSSRTRRPVTISIPVASTKERFTLKQAERILKQHGARPATKDEAALGRKFGKHEA